MPPAPSPSDDVLDGMLDDIFADAAEPGGEVVEPSPSDNAADAAMAEPSGEDMEPSPPGDAKVDEGKGVSMLLDDEHDDVEPPPARTRQGARHAILKPRRNPYTIC